MRTYTKEEFDALVQEHMRPYLGAPVRLLPTGDIDPRDKEEIVAYLRSRGLKVADCKLVNGKVLIVIPADRLS